MTTIKVGRGVPEGRSDYARLDDAYREAVEQIIALRAENERLRAALTEIMQGARSVDYAIHVARVALGNDKRA